MPTRLLLTSFLAVVLPAQERGEPPGPIHFDTFPVLDGPPLDVSAATAAAIDALLALQEGEPAEQWPYEGVYREDGGHLPVGYRVGGTAIVVLGLVAAPGFADDARRVAAVERGVAFVLRTLDAPRMQSGFEGTYDVRVWGHVYALTMLLRLQDHGLVPEAHREEVARRIPWLVEALTASAIPDSGGWNYSLPAGYRSPRNQASTFVTATALQALFHAAARGHAVDRDVLEQALAALERARARPGGYAYSAPRRSRADVAEDDLSAMDRTPGSAARDAVCETTLLLAGRGDAVRLERAVERFFEHWEHLAVRKSRTGTHVAPYGIAPYYFLFGHVYAAQAIEQIDDPGRRDELRATMRRVLARSRDADGSWNDRQFLRSAGYGTALALLALHMATLPKPPAWRPAEDDDGDAPAAK